jgi:hypothetical protein
VNVSFFCVHIFLPSSSNWISILIHLYFRSKNNVSKVFGNSFVASQISRLVSN